MVRFQCIHCGGRIAVPDDHMDRMARCPECGGVTHPLAEHISSPDSPDGAKLVAPITDPDAVLCDNCREPLGKLQKQFEWDGHDVCGPCHRMLSLDQAGAEIQPAAAVSVGDNRETTHFSDRASGFIDARRSRAHPTELALAIRTACIGLCIMAGALYVIVSILRSVGYIIMWGAIVIVVLAAAFWIRKGILAIRRRGVGSVENSG